MARAYVAPVAEPTGANELVLAIPNVPEYRALLRGFFLDLTMTESWQEISGVTVDVQTAAEWATVIYDSFEENNQCP